MYYSDDCKRKMNEWLLNILKYVFTFQTIHAVLKHSSM